jgi:hypothetical protein
MGQQWKMSDPWVSPNVNPDVMKCHTHGPLAKNVRPMGLTEAQRYVRPMSHGIKVLRYHVNKQIFFW